MEGVEAAAGMAQVREDAVWSSNARNAATRWWMRKRQRGGPGGGSEKTGWWNGARPLEEGAGDQFAGHARAVCWRRRKASRSLKTRYALGGRRTGGGGARGFLARPASGLARSVGGAPGLPAIMQTVDSKTSGRPPSECARGKLWRSRRSRACAISTSSGLRYCGRCEGWTGVAGERGA